MAEPSKGLMGPLADRINGREGQVHLAKPSQVGKQVVRPDAIPLVGRVRDPVAQEEDTPNILLRGSLID
jgi:hypothetical protein